jgi:hypothetical protein
VNTATPAIMTTQQTDATNAAGFSEFLQMIRGSSAAREVTKQDIQSKVKTDIQEIMSSLEAFGRIINRVDYKENVKFLVQTMAVLLTTVNQLNGWLMLGMEIDAPAKFEQVIKLMDKRVKEECVMLLENMDLVTTRTGGDAVTSFRGITRRIHEELKDIDKATALASMEKRAVDTQISTDDLVARMQHWTAHG